MADIMLRDSDILSKDFSFKDKINVATEVATTLNEVIQTQGLAVNIQGNNYVTAEGWNCLGTMLGTYARTEYVEKIEKPKGYKARVSIMQGDNVLATAEAIATFGGFQKTPQAVYSMAQTRAMGKAYRMCFSWIVKLAGYQPTPAEEMEHPTFNDAYTVEHNVEFTTADKIEEVEADPVIENFAKTVAKQVALQGLKITQKTMKDKAKELARNEEIPEEYCPQIFKYIESNCPKEE